MTDQLTTTRDGIVVRPGQTWQDLDKSMRTTIESEE